MSLKSPTASVCALLPMLVTMFCLAGCASIQKLIPIDATDDPALQAGAAILTGRAAVSDADMRADLCARAWRPQTYSSRDTPETQIEAQGNNEARRTYCAGAEGTAQ